MVTRPAGTYSTADLERLLGVPAVRVRAWAMAVLDEPGRDARGRLRFSFRDVVVLRAARDLAAAGVPLRRVREALSGLRERLPPGRPLASARIAAEGRRVVVREAGAVWEPASGQGRLDFAVADLASQAAPLAERAAAAARARAEELSAEDWFALALDLEAAAPGEAAAAYERALTLAPDHPDAHLNLGRLRHEQGDLVGAERHYRAALASRPEDATAVFNLGVALQDGERWSEAVAAYRRTLEIDASYADAYYNLAAIYEHLGDKAEAIHQLKSYRALVRG